MISIKFTKVLQYFLHVFVYIFYLTNASANSHFIVKNIEIKLPFDNSINIRNLAIKEAENRAFKLLSQKLLTPSDYIAFLSEEEDQNLSYMVESVEFIDEKITTELYKGVFNINFSPYKIREYYSSNSWMFSEVTSKALPVYAVLSNQESFFILNNIWNTKWSDIKSSNQTLQLKIITFNSLESKDFTLTSFLQGDFKKSQEKKDSINAVFVWCEPTLISNGHIEFNIIAKIIINNKSSIISSKYVEEYNLYKDNLLDATISDLKEKLLTKWIELTSQNKEKFQYAFKLETKLLEDWITLKNIFEQIELISKYQITSFDLDNVEGIVEFYGNASKFEIVLSQNNISPVNLGSIYKIQLIK